MLAQERLGRGEQRAPTLGGEHVPASWDTGAPSLKLEEIAFQDGACLCIQLANVDYRGKKITAECFWYVILQSKLLKDSCRIPVS